MVPEFEKQEVRSAGRYLLRCHCPKIKPECGRDLQGSQRGDGQVYEPTLGRHSCLPKVYLGFSHTARASAMTESVWDAKSPKAVAHGDKAGDVIIPRTQNPCHQACSASMGPLLRQSLPRPTDS